jgi:MFS family permease
MPLAIGVGRRVVFLGSTAVLVIGAALCAAAKSYEWLLACRMVIGLAAGQSESVVPMVSQEIFFLHERSTAITVQLAVQTILACVLTLFASPIAGAITPQWWYGLGAILSGLQFILTFFFLPETKYERPLSSYQNASSTEDSTPKNAEGASVKQEVPVYTSRPPLDYVNYEQRTWRSDLRLWVGTPDWAGTWIVLKVSQFSLSHL